MQRKTKLNAAISAHEAPLLNFAKSLHSALPELFTPNTTGSLACPCQGTPISRTCMTYPVAKQFDVACQVRVGQTLGLSSWKTLSVRKAHGLFWKFLRNCRFVGIQEPLEKKNAPLRNKIVGIWSSPGLDSCSVAIGTLDSQHS